MHHSLKDINHPAFQIVSILACAHEAGKVVLTSGKRAWRNLPGSYQRGLFSKLNVWNLTFYDKLLYLDADVCSPRSTYFVLIYNHMGFPLLNHRQHNNNAGISVVSAGRVV